MKTTFAQIVKEKFKFLVHDYGFEILSCMESPRGHFWEGEVNYTTKLTYIYIECTRGEVPSFYIGRLKDIDTDAGINKTSHMLSLRLIYEYMVTTDEEKDVITSCRAPKRANKIVYEDKYIGREIPTILDSEKREETEVEVYAKLIQKYAKPFLLGDFSQWPQIWDYSVKKGIAEQVDYGRSEYIDVVVPDGDGKFRRVGKKHLYQEKLDYIKQLKAEMKQIN